MFEKTISLTIRLKDGDSIELEAHEPESGCLTRYTTDHEDMRLRTIFCRDNKEMKDDLWGEVLFWVDAMKTERGEKEWNQRRLARDES